MKFIVNLFDEEDLLQENFIIEANNEDDARDKAEELMINYDSFGYSFEEEKDANKNSSY